MPKWSAQQESSAKCAKARGSQLRVHFKNCREVGAAIKGMPLLKAQRYLEAVLERKQAIPFRRFAGGCGRHAQGKNLKAPGSQVGWPVKAVKYFIDLLKNAAANAETNSANLEQMVITHVVVQRAAKMRRRTYRAHGRINAYMCSPAHIEIMVTEPAAKVARADDGAKKVSRKTLAKRRLTSGGGQDA
mmetsp:Transcript_37471/g.76551  ORF Transcript_37471/g.76551 Transcript_37471/m.76551 type:complete len:188 (-) Transcript_37471:252-815(-)